MTEETALPSCLWFGTAADHRDLLDEVFDWNIFDVYENTSQTNHPLRQFQSSDAVLDEFSRSYPNGELRSAVYLQLRVRDAGPALTVSKTSVTSGPSVGSVIEHAGIDGCLQFHLKVHLQGHRLEYSNTGTPSDARMGADRGLVRGQNGAVWDIGLCNRVSATLNRRIRKRAIGKLNSVSVLPGAKALWLSGETLYLWSRASTPEAYVSV